MSDPAPAPAASPGRAAGVLHELSPREAAGLIAPADALLVDVREPGEYEAERIPGALLAPLSTFDPRRLPLDAGRPLILHCGTGRRSSLAAQQLFAAGVPEARHIAGGIKAWKQAGLPVVTFDPSTGGATQSGGY